MLIKQRNHLDYRKYRPIMKVANFGGNDDIIVVERPYSSLQTGPAFDLPKIKV